MKIQRKLDTAKATYDIMDLDRKQFSNLLTSYRNQMYIWHNRQVDIEDELLNKLEAMAQSDTLII